MSEQQPTEGRSDRRWPPPGRPGGSGPVRPAARPDPEDYAELGRCEIACRSDVVEGDRSYFRPGELLLSGAAAVQHLSRLESVKAAPDPAFAERARQLGSTLQLWRTPVGTDLIDVVAWLRAGAARRGETTTGIGVNSVWRGGPRYQGGPGGPPSPASPVVLEAGPDLPAISSSTAPDIAVLDTGWIAGLPEELQRRLMPDANDEEQVDTDRDGRLDTQNGHGSFVAGVIHQVDADLAIDPGKVLDTTGIGDDATITLELLETRAPVINLSLGGYTEDDLPPVGLADAIRVLRTRAVLVAAAGNHGSDRPFWPAAFKGVLAVAAYDARDAGLRSAPFSNFGPWVDLCAPGVDIVSTFAHFAGSPVFDGWAMWSGTSFAAPFAAAQVAADVRNGLSRAEAVARLMDRCVDEPSLAAYGPVLRPGAGKGPAGA